MNVLNDYAAVLWDCIEDLGLQDDDTAQAMFLAAESYNDGYFSLVAERVGIGRCELTGEYGVLATVAFKAYETHC